MKNICFFNSIKFWGGGEKLHLENAIEFKNIDYNVFVISKLNSPLWKKANLEKLKTYPISVGNLSFLNPIKIVKLILFYKRKGIDTVIFSSSQDLKLGSISAYFARVERIVYLRGLAVPIKNSLLNRIIFKRILTHIIPNSNETKRNMLKYLGKYVDKEKVRTIYHGIDQKKLSFNKADKLKAIQKKGQGVILGNAGRLTKQKGQDKLIEIAKKLHEQGIDFTLFIAGTGELSSELNILIDKYHLKNNVFLLGFVEDMDKFMNSIDIFLLSSIWEGFGFVLVEAMIKSKPIVAFDITSNPEIVENNKSGFLVSYPNLELFAQKTIQLIKDETLCETMGKEGVRIVRDRFILKDKVLEIESFLKTMPNRVHGSAHK
jgi:glycosyltransferase involved in cell wall biosynthesis